VLCDSLTRKGFRPSIITNLARRLDAAEAECLSRFNVIQISMDTVDEIQLAELRRRVRLSSIVENIDQIRKAARALSIAPPRFALSCGVFDVNFAGLEQVADFAIQYRIASVTFWELVKYPDVPGATNVNSVATLDPKEVARAVACLENTLAKLDKAGITTEVAGDFLSRWRRARALESPLP
jgi:molybdenum cofactor biosynthesis enzyme MoaA